MTIGNTDSIPVQRVAKQPEGQHTYIQVQDLLGAAGAIPAAVAATARVHEYLSGVHVTKITLSALPISVVSVTTGAGVGGTKIYTFPVGFIKRLGCRGRITVSVATAQQADFTDATPEGDIGIGTAAPADADALGTDATDDDWGTATAFTMSSFASSVVVVPSEADGVHDGSSTAIDLYLNALVDAADIDDGVTTSILASGTIWLTWANQGGA